MVLARRSTAFRVMLFCHVAWVVCASDPLSAQSNVRVPNRGARLSESADFADPFVIRDENAYYALATGAHGRNIQAASSTDLVHWFQLPDALPRLPSWASRAGRLTWAPAVLKREAGFVLYYTTREARSGFQCISRAVATHPAGPYTDESSAPLVCQVSGAFAFCGSIDPSPFVDADGAAYLYWKSDENALECLTAPRLWVQRLTDDGLQLQGTAEPLLAMDRDWEARIVEGPSMRLLNGSYFLFTSANWYARARYSIGYATCRTPVGPCEKATTEQPWFTSIGSLLGPGGQEFFRDAAGQPHIVFHAWTAPMTRYEDGGARSLRIAPLTLVGGVPRLVR